MSHVVHQTLCRKGYCSLFYFTLLYHLYVHHTFLEFNAISPAHSNSSVIEAWFSLVRMSGQDDAPRYLAYIKNRQLINAHKALSNNKMYSGDDVGAISSGKDVGIRELIDNQKVREKRKDVAISQYRKNRDKGSTIPTDRFSISAEDASLPDSTNQELEVLRCLTRTKLPYGYMARLSELDTFQQWVRLCLDNDVGRWFDELIRLTRTEAGSDMFNEGCRAIQDQLLRLAAECMRKRRDKSTSFEAMAHGFYKSNKFDQLCDIHLPGNLGKSHAACVMLGLMLAELLTDWIALALRWVRKESNLTQMLYC
eukprot:scaffold2111_cov118-Skeletonema_marinoi.AAC.1